MMAPSTIYLFHNGEVMAFDSTGKQMPDWQGRYADVIPKLLQVRWQGNINVSSWGGFTE